MGNTSDWTFSTGFGGEWWMLGVTCVVASIICNCFLTWHLSVLYCLRSQNSGIPGGLSAPNKPDSCDTSALISRGKVAKLRTSYLQQLKLCQLFDFGTIAKFDFNEQPTLAFYNKAIHPWFMNLRTHRAKSALTLSSAGFHKQTWYKLILIKQGHCCFNVIVY